ncbi:maleylpyruvate isomerase family mycothiol-dependent enzyme [Nocardioides carbamazepini]|uniref:maleylpyruvate isomerase family mycothiol-dependent enzyme n=1 Tax=Nocardioides carbamazepini TaxID=2854259 RepID=UPI00214A047C|nr:maleylpyruvate isomerase family mycothiol-dependent enzyme [Nocardioides carbamazepini]
MTRTPDDALRWARAGTALLADAIAGLSEADLREPTALPGWTRAHVVAHLAGNARALHNLVCWAATGEETPMYGSPGQRAAEIEAGSRRPVGDLLPEFGRTASALDDAMAGLTAAQWEHEVVTAQGRTVPATEIPWLRAREVMVHAVDLDLGVAFTDLPLDFLTALEAEVSLRRGPDLPAVTGTLAERVAWLTGRRHRMSQVGGTPAPDLGPWL